MLFLWAGCVCCRRLCVFGRCVFCSSNRFSLQVVWWCAIKDCSSFRTSRMRDVVGRLRVGVSFACQSKLHRAVKEDADVVTVKFATGEQLRCSSWLQERWFQLARPSWPVPVGPPPAGSSWPAPVCSQAAPAANWSQHWRGSSYTSGRGQRSVCGGSSVAGSHTSRGGQQGGRTAAR